MCFLGFSFKLEAARGVGNLSLEGRHTSSLLSNYEEPTVEHEWQYDEGFDKYPKRTTGTRAGGFLKVKI
jgi:hypothetical protein